MKPLLYLEIRTFINAIKNTLRTPKRLIPALIMAAMGFSWVVQAALFLGGATRLPHMGLAVTRLPHDTIAMIQAGAFLFLSFGTLVIVYQAFASGSLVFSIAHIDFLFPTPISRRSVLLVKLVKDYLKYFFWVAFFVTFTGAPLCLSLNLRLFPYGFISILALTGYLLFMVNLAHTVNIVFTFGFERLKQAGTLIKAALAIVIGSVVILGVLQYVRTSDTSLSFLWAVNSPLIKTVFAPADWCSHLVLAPLGVTNSDMVHLGFIWILAFGSFGLLMSRKENIYEPSLGVSVRASKLRMAMRSGDGAAYRVEVMREKGRKNAGLLVIPPFGRGAVAILWKSLLTRYRMSWSQLMIVVFLPALVLYMIQRFIPQTAVLQNLPFILVYLSFVLSITVQPQVRAELKHANILKSMPVAAWKVMLVQTLNGAIYLALGIWVFAGSMWVLIPAARTSLLATCALGSPFLGFACISATIIPALLYPDTRDAAQNFICNLLGFMLISVAVIPTVVIGLVMLVLLRTSSYTALAPICAVNIIMGAAGIAVSGLIFRRFDPTSE